MSPNNDRFRVLRRLPEIKFEDELRGYSKSQVDRVLETLAPLADEVDELQSRLTQAETRAASAEARLVQQVDTPAAPAEVAPTEPAPTPVVETVQVTAPPDFDETLRKTLLLAQTAADETVRNANASAEETLAAAATEAESLRLSAQAESEELRAENERARAEMETQAAAERSQMLTDAQEGARIRLASLEAELASAHGVERDRLLEEIATLQQTRDELRGDVEALEGHLAQRRNTLRSALTEMSDALDDPAKLRGLAGPDLTDPEVVDPETFAPVALSESSVSVFAEEVPSADDSVLAASQESAAPAAEGSIDGPTVAITKPEADVVTDLAERNEEAVPTEPALATPESEWVDDQLDLVEGSPSADGDDTPPMVDASAGVVLAEAEPLPRRNGPATQAVDAVVDSPQVQETVVESDPFVDNRAPVESWVGAETDEHDEASRIAWDDSDATGEHPVTAMPSPPTAENTMAAPLAPPAPPSGQRPADIAKDQERPAWAETVASVEDIEPANVGSSDPFLDELRRVTDEEPDDDDALGRFLSDDTDDGRGGWFGRRK